MLHCIEQMKQRKRTELGEISIKDILNYVDYCLLLLLLQEEDNHIFTPEFTLTLSDDNYASAGGLALLPCPLTNLLSLCKLNRSLRFRLPLCLTNSEKMRSSKWSASLSKAVKGFVKGLG
jgi:hypothetical protein